MIEMRDPLEPQRGWYWVTPGGGVESLFFFEGDGVHREAL